MDIVLSISVKNETINHVFNHLLFYDIDTFWGQNFNSD